MREERIVAAQLSGNNAWFPPEKVITPGAFFTSATSCISHSRDNACSPSFIKSTKIDMTFSTWASSNLVSTCGVLQEFVWKCRHLELLSLDSNRYIVKDSKNNISRSRASRVLFRDQARCAREISTWTQITRASPSIHLCGWCIWREWDWAWDWYKFRCDFCLVNAARAENPPFRPSGCRRCRVPYGRLVWIPPTWQLVSHRWHLVSISHRGYLSQGYITSSRKKKKITSSLEGIA